MKRKHTALMLLLLFCLLSCEISCRNAESGQESWLREAVLVPAADSPVSGEPNPCTTLSVPTCITKIQDTFFIVDCYHDQIIYSDSLSRPLPEWQVMTDQISRGHTLAGDGVVYLADDTENHRVLVFEKEKEGFRLTQIFPDIGTRPHFVVYDENTALFYVLSSMSGEIYVFKRLKDSSRMVLKDIRSLEKLNGVYVRSFTILDDEIYFVSGNSSIIRARLSDLEILEEYPVPPQLAGMIQLEKIQGAFYITISTDLYGNQDYATILRTGDLHSLADGDYEDIYHLFAGGGTPYYMGSFDGHFYLTEHRLADHAVWQFDVKDGQITNIRSLY